MGVSLLELMPQDEQTIERPERNRRHHEQVHRGDAVRMIAQKRPRALRRWPPPPRDILGHTRLPDSDAEFEQFAITPWGSPERMGKAPVRSEPGAVPSKDGFRPDDRQCMANICTQSGEANENQPVEDVEAEPLRRGAPEDDGSAAAGPGSRLQGSLVIGTTR